MTVKALAGKNMITFRKLYLLSLKLSAIMVEKIKPQEPELSVDQAGQDGATCEYM